VAPRGLYEVDAHDCVVVEESSRVRSIRADSTHDCGQVNQDFGSMFSEEALDGVGARKIETGMSRSEDIAAAHPIELPDQVAPEEACAAGNHDSLVRKTDHEYLSSAASVN
jgi:hypothetical protein